MSVLSTSSIVAPTSSVLLVSGRPEDHAELRNIFRGSRWNLQEAWTGRDGLESIHRSGSAMPVVICENRLPDGDWIFFHEQLERTAVRPTLIVSSRLADERLWADVLNRGAFDLLLSAPFEAEEVERVTDSAWRDWARKAGPAGIPARRPQSALSLTEGDRKTIAAGAQH